MSQSKTINARRRRRGYRVSNRIKRDSTRPRLTIFRSRTNMYAQIIDDGAGRTLASASTVDKSIQGLLPFGGNVASAKLIGKAIGERAIAAGIQEVAFDRGTYKYHGRVAALAEGAREAGLKF